MENFKDNYKNENYNNHEQKFMVCFWSNLHEQRNEWFCSLRDLDGNKEQAKIICDKCSLFQSPEQ